MKPFIRLLALVAALFTAGTAGAQEYPIDKVMGKPDAPITIIEYASLTCPHCARFATTTMPKIKAEWIDTGKAKLIYRDLPTEPAAVSVGASMIAHCAPNYFGVLSLLFEQQEQWMRSSSPLAAIKKLVRLAGMTEDKVDACLKDQGLANAIQARAQDGGSKYGISSTPSFVVNGKLVGALPYEEFDKILKAASKK